MKYAIVAAALAGMAMAIPTNEWENVPKNDDKCDYTTSVYTTKECGNNKDDWNNCKDVTKTKTEWPATCTEWNNTPDDKFCKDGKDKYGNACSDKKDKWCKGGKDQDNNDCYSDDDDWSNWPNGCKYGKDGKGKDKDGKDCGDKKNDWENVPKKDDDKCYTTKVYTTKECGNNKDDWNNCKDVTKTSTDYASTCTEWKNYATTTSSSSAWTTWAPVDDKTCTYETKTNYYTTKECGNNKDDWNNCKDVTKTEYKTQYPSSCTQWQTYATPSSSSSSSSASTWSVWTTEAPKVPAKTSSSAEWNTWKASSTVAAPVAKWTGAADKQTVGFGALAIAAVAALL